MISLFSKYLARALNVFALLKFGVDFNPVIYFIAFYMVNLRKFLARHLINECNSVPLTDGFSNRGAMSILAFDREGPLLFKRFLLFVIPIVMSCVIVSVFDLGLLNTEIAFVGYDDVKIKALWLSCYSFWLFRHLLLTSFSISLIFCNILD